MLGPKRKYLDPRESTWTEKKVLRAKRKYLDRKESTWTQEKVLRTWTEKKYFVSIKDKKMEYHWLITKKLIL